MFLYPEFKSINNRSDVGHGTYVCHCSVYVGKAEFDKAVVCQYRRDGDADYVITELLIFGVDGMVSFCDFVKLKDRSWRDSFGNKSDDLLSLFPKEISRYKFVEKKTLSEVEV